CVKRPRRARTTLRRGSGGPIRQHRRAARAGRRPRRAEAARGDRRVKRASTISVWRGRLGGQIPLITLIVLCLVTALLTPRFLSPLNLTNILVQSSIMAVIAMGMTFVIVGGGVDLSVGSPPPPACPIRPLVVPGAR